MRINVFDAADPSKIKAAGLVQDGVNIILGGMSNGVAQMVANINQLLAATQTKMTLLRIFSHGASGHMQVSAGQTVARGARASIDLSNFEDIKPDLAKLSNSFEKTAKVELHGCEVGGGEKGDKLLQQLADLWNVKVTAGVLVQYSGTKTSQLDFEGPTKTAVPGGAKPVNDGQGTSLSQYIYHISKGEFAKLWNAR